MKKLIHTTFYLSLLLTTALYSQTTCEDLVGVWKYEIEGLRGMSIMSPTHYIAILVNEKRMPFKNAEPTQEEKAAAFEALNFAAGTWSCDAHRGVLNQSFSPDPKLVGTPITFDFELEGNSFKYWRIQPDGSRGPMRRMQKIAEWEEISDCSGLTGVWDHIDLKGLFIQAGHYAAYVVVDKNQAAMAADLGSVAGKAQAFDAVSAAFLVSTCHPGGKTDHHLLSTNPAREGQVVPVEFERQEDGMRAWFLNPDGSRIGDGLRVAPAKTTDAKYAVPRRTYQDKHQALLYQITGAFTGALNIARQNGISAEDYGQKLGELYKHSWNKEAGFEGYIRGMLFNSVVFSTDVSSVEILNQSDTSIEYKWKVGPESAFDENGQLFGTSLDDFYAFFKGVMGPISEYLGATYEQKRMDDGWMWVAIRKR